MYSSCCCGEHIHGDSLGLLLLMQLEVARKGRRTWRSPYVTLLLLLSHGGGGWSNYNYGSKDFGGLSAVWCSSGGVAAVWVGGVQIYVDGETKQYKHSKGDVDEKHY